MNFNIAFCSIAWMCSAVCSWSSGALMRGNITWMQSSFSFAEFCNNSSFTSNVIWLVERLDTYCNVFKMIKKLAICMFQFFIIVFCFCSSNGSSVAVLLNDSCNSNGTLIYGTLPPPSSTGILPLSTSSILQCSRYINFLNHIGSKKYLWSDMTQSC